jgi:hypothetical protein
MKKYARKCSHCGRLFNEGYVIEGGEAYYCSNGCLSKNMTFKEYEDLYADGNGETYFTTWEDEDDFLYYENGDEVI